VTVPSRLPPIVAYCTWARPWPITIIDSLRVSRQRSGVPVFLAMTPSSASSGSQLILAPNPPPTSGAITSTWSGSRPLAFAIVAFAPCAACVDNHWTRRPSDQATAEPRTSSGHGATR
jgi:hypothetical protein